MKKLVCGCAVASLLVAPVAQAQEAAVFRPVGGWTADYGDEYCRLIRTFSDGTGEVSLAFERTQPGTPTRLILVGDGIKTFRGANEIGFAFTPGGNAGKSRVVRSQTTDGKQYLNLDPVTLAASAFTPGVTPPPYNRDSEQEAVAGINGLALDEGLSDPVRFETGSLKAPIAALQACADDLLQVWGLDPAKHRTMTAAAVLNSDTNGVLPQGTIPFGDFGKLNGGANQVRLMIGADGKPTACAIYSPTLTETLNERICSMVMREASFEPAKDADGQPMASYWMGSPMFLGPPFRAGGR